MMKKNMNRALSFLIIILTLIAYSVPALALQGGNITQYLSTYIQGPGGSDLKPDVITLTDGTIAYAIEPHKVSTRAETEYADYTETNETLKKGLEIIMQYGYPLNMGPNAKELDEDTGIAADKARYATAIAIQSWGIHNGATTPEGWADFVDYPESLIAAEGCEDVVSYVRYMLEKAEGQTEMPHGASATNSSGSAMKIIKMREGTGGLQVGFTVKLLNIDQGYKLDMGSLPSDTVVNGFTGDDGDNVTITLPSNCSDEYTITLIGTDDRIAANYKMYTPTNQDDVSKLVAMKMTEPYGTEDVVKQEIKISKTQGDEWSFVDGYIDDPAPEPDTPVNPSASGEYPAVPGSLVVYDQDTKTGVEGVELTIKDGNSTEIKKALTDASGQVAITDLQTGKYFANQSAETGDTNPHKFAVIETTAGKLYKGNTVFLTKKMEKNITIILNNGDDLMEGIEFKICDSTDETVSTATTDEDGQAVFRKLENGTYKITYESSPDDTPKEQVAALKKLSKEVFVTDDHDNGTAIYTFDIDVTSGKKPPTKTGPREIIMATKVMLFLAMLYLAGFFIAKIIKGDGF